MYIWQHQQPPQGDKSPVIHVMNDWPELLLEINLEGDINPLVSLRGLELAMMKNYRGYSQVGSTWHKLTVEQYLKPSSRTWVHYLLFDPNDEDRYLDIYMAIWLKANQRPKLRIVIPRESWQAFDTSQGEYLEIPSLKFCLAHEEYSDPTPPWDNFLGMSALHIQSPRLLLKIHTQRIDTRLAIDIGSFGNVFSVIGSSSRSQDLLDPPINLHEVSTEVKTYSGSSDIAPDSIKYLWNLQSSRAPQLPSLFLTALMEDPLSELMLGKSYEDMIFQQDGSELLEHTFWSAKSYIGQDTFKKWSNAVSKGINRRISLPSGIRRQGLPRDPKAPINSDVMIASKPSSLYLSYPSTWMSSQKEALRASLTESFELNKTDVQLVADEATAGAFGWLATLIGRDADPSTTLALLSEDTLFMAAEEQHSIQKQREDLLSPLKPMYILVVDAGAGTTDISIIRYHYQKSTKQIEAETVARQGFIAGGHEISRALSALWKEKLGEQLQEQGYQEHHIHQTLCTLVSEEERLKHSKEEIDRRKKLMLYLYELAEYEKRRATDTSLSDSPEVIYSKIIQQIKIDDNLDDDLLAEALLLSSEELERICAEVLGSALIGAVDLPAQHGIMRLDQIFLLGRTLRLPNVTEAFVDALKDRIQTLRRDLGGDWSGLLPPPSQIYAWSRTQAHCASLNEKSTLPAEIDKNSVVQGLNLITSARIKGVQSMLFKHYDKNYRQRFIGAARMESWYWRQDLVEGALPGSKPYEFEPFQDDYKLSLSGSGIEEVDIMWNNLGRLKGMSIKLGSFCSELPPEHGYLLGKLKVSKSAHYDLQSLEATFTLVEDGRIALKDVKIVTSQGKETSSKFPNLTKTALIDRLEQSVKVGDTLISYEEEYQHVDYRDQGYISKIYDEM